MVLKLKVTSFPTGWRKDVNYILGTKQINNIVKQSLCTLSITPWGLSFPFLPAEGGTTLFFHKCSIVLSGCETVVTLPLPTWQFLQWCQSLGVRRDAPFRSWWPFLCTVSSQSDWPLIGHSYLNAGNYPNLKGHLLCRRIWTKQN